MCTAVNFKGKYHYFGRNLDFEQDFGESVVITPRNLHLPFRNGSVIKQHYAIIGMAIADKDYPLYFDATNEKGLSMAGLYFPGNAVYQPPRQDMENITPFEFIPWILATCQDLAEARTKLKSLNLVDIPYSEEYPLSPLHWIIAYKDETVVVEPMADGIRIFENTIGVLTNNPPFDFHLHNLANYMNLTREEPTNRLSLNIELPAYSRGMGAIGLPGDLSSASRFVRAAFVKLNAICKEDDAAAISQFFHILGSVVQQEGCVKVGEGFEKTLYTSCCNTDTGVYCYTTYENSAITGISLQNTDLNSDRLTIFPLRRALQIQMENSTNILYDNFGKEMEKF